MQFSSEYQINFSDINIGNHLSSSNYLSYVNNTIADYFISLGFKIDDFFGYKYIMTNVEMDFKSEIKYPSTIHSHMDISFIKKTRIIFSISFEVNGTIKFICTVTGVFLNKTQKPHPIDNSMKKVLKNDI